MSNPNWKGRRRGLSINKQLEEFDLEDCLTREQYLRGHETEKTEAMKPKQRKPKKK